MNREERILMTGMTTQDKRDYSLTRALRAAARRDWSEAPLERAASNLVAEKLGRGSRGVFIPAEVMNFRPEQRDLVAGTDSAGGYTVQTDVLSESFIGMLRAHLTVRAAGATVLSGLVGDVSIPRNAGGVTAYWVAENGAVTESQQTFEEVTLSPKTVGCIVDISHRLLLQTSPDVEQFVRNDLALALATAIDLAALHGTGANNQPTGIAATAGIGSVAGGANGLAPTWDHLVALESAVADANADTGRLAYLTNPAVRRKLKMTPKLAATDSEMVWDVRSPAEPLNGYPAFVTNQVSSTLDKGTSVGVCSAIFYGNWADLLIGMWGDLEILADPYSGSSGRTVRLVALQDVDIAVRHPESFAAMLDALTA